MATMKEKIIEIAEHYGYDSQSRQLVEEMAELMVALNKAWRGREHFSASEKRKVRKQIVEEIADVEIMLEQIKHIIDCDGEVFLTKMRKVDRQIERMHDDEKPM